MNESPESYLKVTLNAYYVLKNFLLLDKAMESMSKLLIFYLKNALHSLTFLYT